MTREINADIWRITVMDDQMQKAITQFTVFAKDEKGAIIAAYSVIRNTNNMPPIVDLELKAEYIESEVQGHKSGLAFARRGKNWWGYVY